MRGTRTSFWRGVARREEDLIAKCTGFAVPRLESIRPVAGRYTGRPGISRREVIPGVTLTTEG